MKLIKSFVLGTMVMVFMFLFSTAIGRAADVRTILQNTSVNLVAASGFIGEGTSGKKYLITNWHVCALRFRHSPLIQGTLADKTPVSGAVVALQPDSDLCAVSLDIVPKAYLKMSDQDAYYKQEVNTVGYPAGIYTMSHGSVAENIRWDYEIARQFIDECPKNSTVNYFDGRVKSCTIHYHSTLTTLFSKPGASGSAIVDDDGKLVGVMSSHSIKTTAFSGGMVSTEDVRKFLGGL